MYPQREGGSFGSYVGQWNNHPPNYTELYISNMLLRPWYLMVSHCSNINVEGVLRSRSESWAGYIYLPGRATKTPDVYPACCKSACHNWIWQGDHDTSKEILIRVSIIDKSKGKKKKKNILSSLLIATSPAEPSSVIFQFTPSPCPEKGNVQTMTKLFKIQARGCV